MKMSSCSTIFLKMILTNFCLDIGISNSILADSSLDLLSHFLLICACCYGIVVAKDVGMKAVYLSRVQSVYRHQIQPHLVNNICTCQYLRSPFGERRCNEVNLRHFRADLRSKLACCLFAVFGVNYSKSPLFDRKKAVFAVFLLSLNTPFPYVKKTQKLRNGFRQSKQTWMESAQDGGHVTVFFEKKQ